MAVGELLAPVGLGGVQGQEADEAVSVEGDVGGDLVVGDPEAGKLGLAAEDDGFIAEGGSGAISVVVDGKVHFLVAAGVAGLALEIVGEVAGVFPEVAVDVDDHGGRIADCREQPEGVRMGQAGDCSFQCSRRSIRRIFSPDPSTILPSKPLIQRWLLFVVDCFPPDYVLLGR